MAAIIAMMGTSMDEPTRMELANGRVRILAGSLVDIGRFDWNARTLLAVRLPPMIATFATVVHLS
jgi:hypothetical protein